MGRSSRPIVALLPAAAAAALVVVIPFGALGFAILPFAFVAILVVATIAGLPLFYLAARFGADGWPTAALAGLAISQLPALDAGSFVPLPWLGLAGVLGGLVFWLCVRAAPGNA